MPLPHAPRWLAQVKSYINLDRQYGWHHLVLPMNALFSEEQMRAKLAPLVTQLGIPTATYYVDGDVWSHKHDPAAIRFAPFASGASPLLAEPRLYSERSAMSCMAMSSTYLGWPPLRSSP